MAGRKQQKLTYTFYIGDKQVDRLPPEYLDKMAQRLGEAMSIYYTKHPDEYRILLESEKRREEKERAAQAAAQAGAQPGA